MANEWVKVELYGANNDGQIVRYTIADGTAVSKGALLCLSSPRTAIAAANMTPAAGIAAEEHVANKGVTSIGCYTQGIFEAVASAGITVGQFVGSYGSDNTVGVIGSNAYVQASQAFILGKSLNTVNTAGTVYVRLNL